jgi:hypothetical protein
MKDLKAADSRVRPTGLGTKKGVRERYCPPTPHGPLQRDARDRWGRVGHLSGVGF